jgi:hypothetical protein
MRDTRKQSMDANDRGEKEEKRICMSDIGDDDEVLQAIPKE